MLVTLEQLKEHLLIEDNTDDKYLLDILTVATDAVLRDCNLCGECICASPTLIHSILLLAGTLYNNRESVSFATPHSIPHTFEYLKHINKNYNGDIF